MLVLIQYEHQYTELNWSSIDRGEDLMHAAICGYGKLGNLFCMVFISLRQAKAANICIPNCLDLQRKKESS